MIDTEIVLSWFDYVLIAIIGISAIIGLVRGFIKEAFSLSIWILAFWISWTFFQKIALHLEPYIDSPTVRLGLAFILILLLCLLVGRVISFILIKIIDRSGMSSTDRIFGVIFGMARGTLIVSIAVIIAGLTTIPQEEWWKNSSLITYFEEAAMWLRGFLPDDFVDILRYD
tara:strand:- start:222 stop:734 length:513 start_codon:yes stop_codon:yes gene_type:complete